MLRRGPRRQAEVIDVARGLEGLRRQDGIHAAAVVITREPLTEYLPIQRKPEPGGDLEDAPIVTQYEMHGVEELGLLKMDFLGLRNLVVIEITLDLIEASDRRAARHRPRAARRRADVRDAAHGPTRSACSSSRAPPMRSPAAVAGADQLRRRGRPGRAVPARARWPRTCTATTPTARTAASRSTYLHPDLEPILGDTYGLMIYQEPLMRVAQNFAGYTLEEADNLRKAAGKKDPGADRRRSARSSSTAASPRATARRSGTQLFDMIEPFADYAFNKSHAYGYGYVAYQTAWLKANYPVEYLAALLTSVKDNKDKTAVYLAECRSHAASRCSSPTSTGRRPTSRCAPARDGRCRRDLVFGLVGGPQRRRGPGRPASSPSATPGRPVRRLLRLLPARRPGRC